MTPEKIPGIVGDELTLGKSCRGRGNGERQSSFNIRYYYVKHEPMTVPRTGIAAIAVEGAMVGQVGPHTAHILPLSLLLEVR